jgi:hypothetical protein
LRDFATITLNEGDSQVMTVIVNTDLSGGNLMIELAYCRMTLALIPADFTRERCT